MDLNEIDQKIAELQKLRAQAERVEELKLARQNHKEAVDIYDRLINYIRPP